MSEYFLDSSALVKRYVLENGSAWIRSLFTGVAPPVVFVAAITPVEVVSAITRRFRNGSITEEEANAAVNALRLALETDYEILGLDQKSLQRAFDLAVKHGLRAYDAVQLATAMQIKGFSVSIRLPAITFVSADNELNKAAALEGLLVENPNSHP